MGKVQGWEFDDRTSAEAKFKSLGKLKASIITDSNFNELKFWGVRKPEIISDLREWWECRQSKDADKLLTLDNFLTAFILPDGDAEELQQEGCVLSMDSENIAEDSTEGEDAVILRTKSMMPRELAPIPEDTSLTRAKLEENEGRDPEELDSQAICFAQRIASSADVCALETWWGVGPSVPDRRLERSMPGHVMISEVSEVMVMKARPIEQLLDQLPLQDLCSESGKYVMWQLILGKVCLLSLHRIISDETYETVVGVGEKSLLNDALKLIVTPVNLSVSAPIKGPKDADTVGSFFGLKHVHFTRASKAQGKYDIAMLSVDLYSVWSLRMLLPSIASNLGEWWIFI